MSEEKLLPCPMCGGKAVKSAFSWGNICDEYTVKCTECGVGTKVLKSDEAINAWNTRKPMDDIVAELKRIKMNYFLTIANTGDAKNDFAYENVGNALDKAIEIVKGGVED